MKLGLRKRCGIVLVAVYCATIWSSGCVTIVYHRFIENQPLRSPVRVAQVETDRLTLADGRHITIQSVSDSDPGDIEGMVRGSDWLVDLEEQPDGSVAVFAKCRRPELCGTPFPPIEIPLIREDLPRYWRMQIAVGRWRDEGLDR